MYYSLHVVKIKDIVYDQNMDTYKYVAIPSKEEQEFISYVINKFDRNSQFGKNYFGV